MSYIVTYNPGTENERSEVIRYLMDFDEILENLEEWPDGFAIMIRKASYLDTREVANPKRVRHLSVVPPI